MQIKTIGSICSGIEAASVAWKDFQVEFCWFSEIAEFPSRVLKIKYPNIPNIGDMCEIPNLIKNEKIEAPDFLCAGTPCQAFSLAGWKKGLEDDRGNLTLKFYEAIEENDKKREGKDKTIVMWENVEGVLSDRTNAFGSFISLLAGCDEEIRLKKYPTSGILRGPKRNVAWRVIDAKYFGLPQQRRRLYLIAGGKDFSPEYVLFEQHEKPFSKIVEYPLNVEIQGNKVEFFRAYTDCLYSAYGTKWNGNAAAYNGSLFIHQNSRLRRLTPLECERLMGFPDNYTNITKAYPTNRYQAVGNSWAVPVVRWIGGRLFNYHQLNYMIDESDFSLLGRILNFKDNSILIDMSGNIVLIGNGVKINGTEIPENVKIGNLAEIVEIDAEEKFYISPAGCYGILRRKEERSLKILKRLEEVLIEISSKWSEEEIERVSRVQKRGRFSN